MFHNIHAGIYTPEYIFRHMNAFKISDSGGVVDMKITRNGFASKLLKARIDICMKEVEIRNIYVSSCELKLNTLDTINAIEEMQRREYLKSREETVNELTTDLGNDASMIADINRLQCDIDRLKEESMAYLAELNRLNDAIPTKGIAVNYVVRPPGYANPGRGCGASY